MSRLLTAQSAAVLGHVFVYIFISHGSLGIADARLVKGFVQAKIGHHRSHHRVGDQFASFLHVFAVNIQNGIAVHHPALLIHTQTPVCIAVIGKAHIQTIVLHQLLQPFDVRGTSIFVDVGAVRLGIDDIGFGTQGIKNRLGNVPGAAVGTIQTYFHALEGIQTQRNEIPHVTIPSCHVVHRAADFFPVGIRDLRIVLVKHMELSVQIILHQADGTLIHLFPIAIHQLDAVVVVRIVAGGNHDAAVKAIGSGHVSH